MAPIPSNNTGCLFVIYQVCGEDHTMLIRYTATGTVSNAMAVAHLVFSAVGAISREITIIQALHRLINTNVTFPITWAGDPTYGSGAGTHDETAYFMDFVGRTNLGSRARISVFGFPFSKDGTGHDFRLLEGEDSTVAAVLAVLDAASLAGCAVDGELAVWHRYANVGTNAYWRNRIR